METPSEDTLEQIAWMTFEGLSVAEIAKAHSLPCRQVLTLVRMARDREIETVYKVIFAQQQAFRTRQAVADRIAMALSAPPPDETGRSRTKGMKNAEKRGPDGLLLNGFLNAIGP